MWRRGLAVLVSDDDFVEDTTDFVRSASTRCTDAQQLLRQPLVLARDQFVRYPDTHQRFWSLLQASFLTKSFLFLGFSFEDPNFEQIFRLVRRVRGSTPSGRTLRSVEKRPDGPSRTLRPSSAVILNRSASGWQWLKTMQLARTAHPAARGAVSTGLACSSQAHRLAPNPQNRATRIPRSNSTRDSPTLRACWDRSLVEFGIRSERSRQVRRPDRLRVLESGLQAQGGYGAHRFWLLRRSKTRTS